METPSTGLTTEQVHQLLLQYGPNEVPSNKLSAVTIFLRQFKSSFLYLLIGAALVSLILGEKTDAVMIGIFIAINTILGFLQEYRSEKTVHALNKYLVGQVHVKRNGLDQFIPQTDLVPGDRVYIDTGDIVSADGQILTATNLQLDESILTGESISVHKQSPDAVFSGTRVVSGSAILHVTHTGIHTKFGTIGKLAATTKRESTFEKGINNYSRFIVRLVMLTLVILILANLALKPTPDISQLFLFSIALAVSVVPEALPVVITFSLSRGAKKLASHKVVVKRLSAIEDLGSIEVLCTDKTGTLTENKLTLDQIYSNTPTQTQTAAILAGHDSNDPFDIALQESDSNVPANSQLINFLPFDPNRRRVTVVIKQGAKYHLISRGAIETILPLCTLTKSVQSRYLEWAKREGRMGKRILAVATKPLVASPKNVEQAEAKLKFLGLISFTDPIKGTTKQALQMAAKLGVQVKIITGDSPEVAGNVAESIGLIPTANGVILGTEFQHLTTNEQYQAAQKYHVFARVTPEQKYQIIKTLQSKYQVGFLGEGINDAPALKIANVGLVVQSAADISRENADIILLQKSLLTVISGIQEGREVFVNTTKYLKSTLASNFGNFYAVATASLLIPFLPMLPLQILLVNLLSDFPMIAIASDNVDPSETRKPQTYNIKQVITVATTLGLISTIFDFIFFGYFSRFSPSTLQTNWFIGSILTELVFIFCIRTPGFFLNFKAPSKVLVMLCCIAGFITVIIPYLPATQDIFKFTPPTIPHLLLILGLVILYFISSEITKLLVLKRIVKHAPFSN